MKSAFNSWLYWFIAAAALALDQATKLWAIATFSLPDGSPDYFKSVPVLGDWIQFRLVYNSGAAFGLKPQSILPFLSPTVFYTVFTAVAMTFFILYYRRLKPEEIFPRLGIVLILSGAVGNLVDRLRLHKVTDFIDVGIPGVSPRWPTFNVADSCVCIGMGILLLLPLFSRRPVVE